MAMKPGQYVEQRDIEPYPNHYTITREDAPTKVLVTDGDGPREWALVQRHVGGWDCIATGTLDDEATAQDVAKIIKERHGDGFAHLPRDRFVLDRPEGEMIHILREGGNDTYCGSTAANPYVHAPGKNQQHHGACTDAYRAEHYGRCPVEGN
jgi:hypothetical protein